MAYFADLFTSRGCDGGDIFRCVKQKVTTLQNQELIRPFKGHEIKDAIFSMHPDKSPGPDGMNPGFFQHFWDVIGEDVISSCLYYLNNQLMPTGLNTTSIVLIPKVKHPDKLSDLRPISLCNVLYKIMAKAVANRLKIVLPSIISDSQSAFILGRLITDNVMVAFEVGHYLKRKRQGKEGMAAFKIDMSKAYDRIEWEFLKHMMMLLGFNVAWVNLIMMCVSTVEYVITHEGRELGPIKPGRGLRQSDPLSPYLFLICAEGLSSIFYEYEERGLIHGCRVTRNALVISHLFFADDSFIFFQSQHA